MPVPANIIQRVEQAMGGKRVNPEAPNAELITWLKNYREQPNDKTPELDKLAREVAWALAEARIGVVDVVDDQDKLPYAIKYLYAFSDSTSIKFDDPHNIDRDNKISAMRFKEGHFIIYPSRENWDQYIVVSSKQWNKKVSVGNAPGVAIYTSLYSLYQAAIQEISAIPVTLPVTLATFEASRTLEACFKLENTNVPAFIQERKDRLAVLMLKDVSATSLPEMHKFWLEYEKIYNAFGPEKFPAISISNEPESVTPIENNDFTAAFAQFKTAARENATAIDNNDLTAAIAALPPTEVVQGDLDRALYLATEFYVRGMILNQFGCYARALESFDWAIEQRPDHPEAYCGKGIALNKLGRHTEALAAFDWAREQRPRYSDAHYGRGIALNKLGRHEDAMVAFAIAAALNQADAVRVLSIGREQKIERKRVQEAMDALIHEYEATVTATEGEEQKSQIIEFLRNRKNTTKENGYTHNPYTPENLFCARLALSLVDRTESMPLRQQFWTFLYPGMRSVFLGENPDWPDYGKALLSENEPFFLINYQTVAVMSQHFDARAIMMGETLPENACDKILVECLRIHSYFVMFTEADSNNIKSFNPVDANFWFDQSRLGLEINKIMHKEIPNFLVFFRELLEIYTRYGYRATPGEGRRVGDETQFDNPKSNTPQGQSIIQSMLKALSPYLQVFALPAFMKRLEQIRDEFAPNSQSYKNVQYLIERFTDIGTCFNQQYADTSNIIGDPKNPNHSDGRVKGDNAVISKLEEVTLGNQPFAHWKGIIAKNSRDTRPKLPEPAYVAETIAQVSSPLIILELHSRVNNISDTVLAERFQAITHDFPMQELWNLLAANLPRPEFVHLLFPNGVPANRLQNTTDCRWTLQLYKQYPNLANRDILIRQTLTTLRAQDDLKVYQESRPSDVDKLNTVAPLIRMLIEHTAVTANEIAFLKDIALPRNVSRMATFLTHFTGDTFESVLTLFKDQLIDLINSIPLLENMVSNFSDAAEQEVLIRFFFDVIKERSLSMPIVEKEAAPSMQPVEEILQALEFGNTEPSHTALLVNLFGKLEPAVCATTIMRLVIARVNAGIDSHFPGRALAYLGTLLYNIIDINKFGEVLLILLEASAESAARNPATALNIRLYLFATNNAIGNVLSPISVRSVTHAAVFCNILIESIDDFEKVMKKNPMHRELILRSCGDFSAFITSFDTYIRILNILESKADVDLVLSKAPPICFFTSNTVDKIVKLIQSVTNRLVLDGFLAALQLQLSGFCNMHIVIVTILQQLNAEQAEIFLANFSLEEFYSKNPKAFETELPNLNDLTFNKVIKHLGLAFVTKENFADYFSTHDTPTILAEKIIRIDTHAGRTAFLKYKDFSHILTTAENIVAILEPVEIDNRASNKSHREQCKNILARFDLSKLPKTTKTLMTLANAKLRPDILTIILRAMPMPENIVANADEIKECFGTIDAFVKKLSSLTKTDDCNLLIEYADFPVLLKTMADWQKLLPALRAEGKVMYNMLKKYPLTIVKTTADLVAVLKDVVQEEQCLVVLSHITQFFKGIETIEDWITVFKTLNATQANVVATTFDFKEISPTEKMRSEVKKMFIELNAEQLAVPLKRLEPFLKSLSTYGDYDVQVPFDLREVADVLNWSPRGTEESEIAKLTEILKYTFPFHSKLVKMFDKDPARQRQLIIVMFSEPYIGTKLKMTRPRDAYAVGLSLKKLTLEIFNSEFKGLFIEVSATTHLNSDQERWRDIALRTVLKNLLKDDEPTQKLNDFLANSAADDVRMVLKIILEMIKQGTPGLDSGPIMLLVAPPNSFSSSDEKLAVLIELVGENPELFPRDARERIIDRLVAISNRGMASNIALLALLKYYNETGSDYKVASILVSVFTSDQKKVLNYVITRAQFSQFHHIYNEDYLFRYEPSSYNDRVVVLQHECIGHYFDQLSSQDKVIVLLDGLNNENYRDLYYAYVFKPYRDILIEGLKENRERGDGALFSQALNQLMVKNVFTPQKLASLRTTVSLHLNGSIFSTQSCESVAIAKVINQFVIDKSDGTPLTSENKLTLFSLMYPYMENKEYRENFLGKARTLYIALQPYYVELAGEIGFYTDGGSVSFKDQSPPAAYSVYTSAYQQGWQHDLAAFENTLKTGETSPTNAKKAAPRASDVKRPLLSSSQAASLSTGVGTSDASSEDQLQSAGPKRKVVG